VTTAKVSTAAGPEIAIRAIATAPHPLDRAVTNAGQLDTGLLFVCFQSDLAAGFLTGQSRLNGEQLEEYIKQVGGGYFFVLPGVQSKDNFFAEGLLRAAA
jgi:deferrochelatase/peroxidase EfeB